MSTTQAQIEFIPNVGHRLTASGRSLVLHSLSSGGRLNNKELMGLVKAQDDYLAAMRGWPALEWGDWRPASLTDPDSNVGYKSCSEEVFGLWFSGSFRIGSPAYYQNIEQAQFRDEREGVGIVALHDKTHTFTAGLTGGLNYRLFCLAKSARHWERPSLTKFGPRLIRINGLDEFADKMAKAIGAKRVLLHDIVYSDVKLTCRTSTLLDEIRQALGTGDLNETRLVEFSEVALRHLLEEAALPLMFVKPKYFMPERERRLAFEMAEDVTPFEDRLIPELVQHLDVVV